MRSFVHILTYFVVLGCQLMLVLISIHVQLQVQTLRLFTSLRIQRKHGYKAEPPRTLLNEPIHSFWSFDRRITEIYSPQRIARSNHKYSTHDVP